MKKQLNLKVENLRKITEQHILLSLVAPNGDMPEIKAGQFVEVKVDNAPTVFLRRPISVHFVDYAKQRLDLLVALVGDGTRKMATLSVGDEVSVLLPLGNGFPMPTKAGISEILPFPIRNSTMPRTTQATSVMMRMNLNLPIFHLFAMIRAMAS